MKTRYAELVTAASAELVVEVEPPPEPTQVDHVANEIIAMITAPLGVGVPYSVGFDRKESSVATVLAGVDAITLVGLRERIVSEGPLAQAFQLLAAPRRTRLVKLLGL